MRTLDSQVRTGYRSGQGFPRLAQLLVRWFIEVAVRRLGRVLACIASFGLEGHICIEHYIVRR